MTRHRPHRPLQHCFRSCVMTTRTNSGQANPDKLRSRFFLTFCRSAGMIIAGYDHRHGGQVYSIPLGGSLHKQSYAIGGSGSTYIYGYCDAKWRESMTEQEGIDFVKKSLREAIKWDGSSGGVIRLVVLTAKGAVRHLYLPDNGYTGPGSK